jgi:cytochrome bd ubiquinol oxidase subunit II
MTAGDGVAVVLMVGVTLYTWTGVADFGAGFWDLISGGRRRGERPRALIDSAIGTVWEANHVWLVFCIVVCWTAFGPAFASIMTTLYIPLTLAALGIVLRGSSFAFRKNAARARQRHIAGWTFGIGSIVTPFFLGATVGSLLAGRVPEGVAAGDRLTSWWNPTSVLVGLLAVALGAFLAAVYLVVEANHRGERGMHDYFRIRAIAAGGVAVLVGIGAVVALRVDDRRMYERVTGRGLPLLLVASVALIVTLVLVARRSTKGVRAGAALAVSALVWTWGVSQFPYLLPFDLTIDDGAGAAVTMRWILVWFLIGLVTAVPALILLYVLGQRGEIAEDPGTPEAYTGPTGLVQ